MIICLICVSGCGLKSQKTQITSDPTGAEVYLQHDFLGETPIETTVEQQTGDYNIYILRAEKDGYIPNQKFYKEQFFGDTVVEAVPPKVHFVMEKRKKHVISITSNPSGAKLIFNGNVIGETPIKVSIQENIGVARVFNFTAEMKGFKSKHKMLKEFIPEGKESPSQFPESIHFEF